jgi:hypothetical protein
MYILIVELGDGRQGQATAGRGWTCGRAEFKISINVTTQADNASALTQNKLKIVLDDFRMEYGEKLAWTPSEARFATSNKSILLHS